MLQHLMANQTVMVFCAPGFTFAISMDTQCGAIFHSSIPYITNIGNSTKIRWKLIDVRLFRYNLHVTRYRSFTITQGTFFSGGKIEMHYNIIVGRHIKHKLISVSCSAAGVNCKESELVCRLGIEHSNRCAPLTANLQLH